LKVVQTLVLLVIAAAIVPLPVQAQTGGFDRTLLVAGPVSLDVSASAGAVSVHTGPGDSVHVVAKIRAENSWADWVGWFGASAADEIRKLEANPPIEQQGNTIRIGHIDDLWHLRHITID